MALDYFKTITGKFVIETYQPDGDSLRFIADDLNLYEDLHRGYKISPSKKDGSVQLRLEGMDAPETHYGSDAQPYGDIARDKFLRLLGFSAWQLAANGKTVTSSTPQFIPGVIFTKGADIHGRPISYVVSGTGHAAENGTMRPLGITVLQHTLNYRMVAHGHAYALLYSSTPLTHRMALRAASKHARTGGQGFWPKDETELFTLTDQASIGPNGALIFPKLFRRCTDFLKDAQTASVGYDLQDWLLDNPIEDDKLFVERQHDDEKHIEVPLHVVIEQRNKRITFQADILDVVFIEK